MVFLTIPPLVKKTTLYQILPIHLTNKTNIVSASSLFIARSLSRVTNIVDKQTHLLTRHIGTKNIVGKNIAEKNIVEKVLWKKVLWKKVLWKKIMLTKIVL